MRSNHDVRSIYCPAKLTVTLVRDDDDAYHVRVNSYIAHHNHRADSTAARFYHESRKVSNPETLRTVHTLWKGAKLTNALYVRYEWR